MKYTEDNLPTQFKFLTMSGIDYTATVIGDNVTVSWQAGGLRTTNYSLSEVVSAVNVGSWKMTDNLDKPTEEPNGTDADGNPMYFDITMLKPLQRVVVRDSLEALSGIIAVTHSGIYEGRTVVIYEEGGYDLITTGGIAPTDVSEVYAQPDKVCHTYDQRERGKLLWKATVKKTQVQLDAELEKASLEANIVARNAAIAVHEQQIENHNLRITAILKELA